MHKVDLNRILSKASPPMLAILERARDLSTLVGAARIVAPRLVRAALDEDRVREALASLGVDPAAVEDAADAATPLETSDGKTPGAPNNTLIEIGADAARLLERACLIAWTELSEPEFGPAAMLVAVARGETRGEARAEDALAQSLSALRADGALKRLHDRLAQSDPAHDEDAADPLARFCVDLTAMARQGELDPVFGREAQTRRLVEILARRRKNNPIVIGDAGVGKTALVEGLALKIAAKATDLPRFLLDSRILSLDLGLIEAGSGLKGEFEERLKAVVNAVKGADELVILFIDEAHALIGAGSRPGRSDAANLLKPALARGELRTIAATTWSEYKRWFEKDPALSRRFTPVDLEEPSVEATKAVLRGLKARYEADHGAPIRDEALTAAAELAGRRLPGRFLPDKAIDLLDVACARVKIGLSTRPKVLDDVIAASEDRRRAADSLLKDKELGLAVDEESLAAAWSELNALKVEEEHLTAIWRDDMAAVRELDAVRADPEASRKLRLKLKEEGRPKLIKLEVDAEVVAKTVADFTGVGVERLLASADAERAALHPRLAERVRGQDEALARIADRLELADLGLTDPGRPRAVFCFVGPSGVGKTFTAHALAQALFADEAALTVIPLSEYQERHALSRLIGSPPGFVGFEEGGLLTDAVRRRPYSVFLLEDADKGHPEILDLFKHIFETGRILDAQGRPADFRHTVFVLTQTSDDSREPGLLPGTARKPRIAENLSGLVEVVLFEPLSTRALLAAAQDALKRLGDRILLAHRVELAPSPAFIERAAAHALSLGGGGRGVERAVQALAGASIAKALAQIPKPRRIEL